MPPQLFLPKCPPPPAPPKRPSSLKADLRPLPACSTLSGHPAVLLRLYSLGSDCTPGPCALHPGRSVCLTAGLHLASSTHTHSSGCEQTHQWRLGGLGRAAPGGLHGDRVPRRDPKSQTSPQLLSPDVSGHTQPKWQPGGPKRRSLGRGRARGCPGAQRTRPHPRCLQFLQPAQRPDGHGELLQLVVIQVPAKEGSSHCGATSPKVRDTGRRDGFPASRAWRQCLDTHFELFLFHCRPQTWLGPPDLGGHLGVQIAGTPSLRAAPHCLRGTSIL